MACALGLSCIRAQGGSSQLRALGLCVEEAHLLVLKCQPERQVSDLINVWGSAKFFSGDGDWWAPSFFPFFFPVERHLPALPLPPYSLLVSPRQTLIH